ncbi:MAG: CDP-glycerol glycerophosphotransferase family protein [Lachnospiraceae bacterium]|nr:CDP-glycerol glycerophosphotransferase family protein [Lachnospiraceae bacterium]
MAKIFGEFDIDERNKLVHTPYGAVVKALSGRATKSASDHFFEQPIQKNTVLLLGLGHNVRGNMYYILNELNQNPRFADYRVYVRSSPENKEVVAGYIKDNNWTRTEQITEPTEYSKILECVNYLITETFFPESWVKKPGQVYINIWHGTPLKKLGLDKNSTNMHTSGEVQKSFISADYMVEPNDAARDSIINAYKVSNLMNAKVIMLGYPRTGGMLQALSEDDGELRKRLAPNGEKLYAYMPTFRDYLSHEEIIAQTKDLLDYLDENLGDDRLLYVNLHHLVKDSLDYSGYRHIKVFPPDIDSYRLLAVTEALISDYSSVFFDYLATRKQIILFCDDYELYVEKRGTYMDLLSFPFDKVRTKEEVLAAIKRGKTYDDEEIHQRICGYDTKDNAARLCALLTENPDLSDYTVCDIKKDDRRRMLVFSESFREGEETKRLYELSDIYDRTKNEIYFSGVKESIDKNRDSAYPLLKQDHVIGVEKKRRLTGKGSSLLLKRKKGWISFRFAMKYLIYDLALAARRYYAGAKFDKVLLYDMESAFRLIILSTMDSERILFITKEIIRQIETEKVSNMKHALLFAAPRANSIYAMDEEVQEKAKKLLASASGVPEIQLLRDASHLKQILEA